jgi:hypothetical protein
MTLLKSLLVPVFLHAVGSLWGSPFAEENQADIVYGNGVHAFFEKKYQNAVDILVQTEKLENSDPRPYYFLALSYYRLNESEKADQYFKKAAALEWNGRAAKDYSVAEALRRIQGKERLRVERYRQEARTNWQLEEKKRREIKYGEEKISDTNVVKNLASKDKKLETEVLTKLSNSFGAKAITPLNPPLEQPKPVVVKEPRAAEEAEELPEDADAEQAVESDPFADDSEPKKAKPDAETEKSEEEAADADAEKEEGEAEEGGDSEEQMEEKSDEKSDANDYEEE